MWPTSTQINAIIYLCCCCSWFFSAIRFFCPFHFFLSEYDPYRFGFYRLRSNVVEKENEKLWLWFAAGRCASIHFLHIWFDRRMKSEEQRDDMMVSTKKMTMAVAAGSKIARKNVYNSRIINNASDKLNLMRSSGNWKCSALNSRRAILETESEWVSVRQLNNAQRILLQRISFSQDIHAMHRTVHSVHNRPATIKCSKRSKMSLFIYRCVRYVADGIIRCITASERRFNTTAT